jgi:hypothetical protein
MPTLFLGRETLMKTIEDMIALHGLLGALVYADAVRQTISTQCSQKKNQARDSITFKTSFANYDKSPLASNDFPHGFGCVEINLTADIAGFYADGVPRTGTDISVLILDRSRSGLPEVVWQTSTGGVEVGAQLIGTDMIIPLLSRLLGLAQEDNQPVAMLAHERRNCL